MRRVAIVQARLNENGKRFPGGGKVLHDLGFNKPMLLHVLERVQASFVDSVVVATPNEGLATIAETWGYPVYVGSEEDVLDRYWRAAQEHRADVVVRITADCPMIDPDVINECLTNLSYHDYCSNVLDRTYPKGLDVEVFPFDTLARLNRLAHSQQDREHVTLFVRNNAALFDTVDVSAPRDDSVLNVSVDTPEDLERVRRIYKECGDEYHYQKWLGAAYGAAELVGASS